MTRYVLIGGGVASMAASFAIRERDADGEIVMVRQEDLAPYFRAGLSEWMHDRIDDDEILVRPHETYAQRRIDQRHGEVTSIDVEGKTVTLRDGDRLGWDKLLIATGADPWVPPWQGRDLGNIFTYRTFRDVQRIRAVARANPGKPAVVIGGGILGLEFAYDCKGLGIECVMLVRTPDMGAPIFDEASGRAIAQRLRDDGVQLLVEEEAVRFEGDDGDVHRVITDKGRTIECAMVVVAVGVRANLACLDGSPIEAARYLSTDASCATNVPDIYAAGDVAEIFDPRTGAHRPVRTWEPAYLSGQVAGANMAGADAHYIPCTMMNASLVYDLNYVLLGEFMATGDAIETIVAKTSQGAYGYRKLLLKDGRILGGTFLQDRRQILAYRALMAEQIDISPWRARLFDDALDANLMLPAGRSDYYFF